MQPRRLDLSYPGPSFYRRGLAHWGNGCAAVVLLVGLAGSGAPAQADRGGALEISLSPSGASNARFAPFGSICVRLPEEFVKEFRFRGNVRDLSPSTPGWQGGPHAEREGWLYFLWDRRGERLPHARTAPVLLGGLPAGDYVVDFLPARPSSAQRPLWVASRPVECHLRGRTKIVLELGCVRPMRVDVRVRPPGHAGAKHEGWPVQCFDVTAGHMYRIGERQAGADGKVSFLLSPTRAYELAVRLGTPGSSIRLHTAPFRPEDFKQRVLEWDLAKALLGSCRIDVVLLRDGELVPFREEARFTIKGQNLDTGIAIAGGRRVLSVFESARGSSTCLVAGNRYVLATSNPTAKDFYIAGEDGFDVRGDLRGEQVFQLVLARKCRMQFQCADAGTGRPVSAFTVAVQREDRAQAGQRLRYPLQSGENQLSLDPGRYKLTVAAQGHKAQELEIEIKPGESAKAPQFSLVPLDLLKVEFRVPDDQKRNLEARLIYTDRHEPGPGPTVQRDGTVVFAYDNARPAALHVRDMRPEQFAAAVVFLEPGQKQALVELSRGHLFEAEVRLGGRPLGETVQGGLVFVLAGERRFPYASAWSKGDGRVAARLMPGRYSVYLMAKGDTWGKFHLQDVEVDKDVKRTYRLGGLDELKGSRVQDFLRPPG